MWRVNVASSSITAGRGVVGPRLSCAETVGERVGQDAGTFARGSHGAVGVITSAPREASQVVEGHGRSRLWNCSHRWMMSDELGETVNWQWTYDPDQRMREIGGTGESRALSTWFFRRVLG
jgi:hypothetical protein